MTIRKPKKADTEQGFVQAAPDAKKPKTQQKSINIPEHLTVKINAMTAETGMNFPSIVSLALYEFFKNRETKIEPPQQN